MSIESLIERFVAAQERQAVALETIAAGIEPKRPVGRPKKVETVEPAPQAETAAPAAVSSVDNSILPDAKPAAEMPVVQPNVTSTVDLKAFQTLVAAACGKGLSAKVMPLFAQFGGDRASTVPEANRAAAYAAVEAIVKEAAAKAAA
jgi:hypothetical protein